MTAPPPLQLQPHPTLSSQYEMLKISWAPPSQSHNHRHILIVELYNPRKRNAISSRMWKEIGHLFSQTLVGRQPMTGNGNDDIRVVILKGHGRQAFTAGIDLGDTTLFPKTKKYTTNNNHNTSDDNNSSSNNNNNNDISSSLAIDVARQGLAFGPQIRDMQQCFTAIEQCPIPVIAAIEGSCIGAGIDLCCACDIRLCDGKPTTQFSVREVHIGLAADIGTLQRLPKSTGNDSRVRELCYTGDFFDAAEALRIGLVSRVTAATANGDVLHDALQVAERIAANSPVAVMGTKQSLVYSRDHTVADGLEHVAMHNMLALMTEDIPKAVKAGKQKTRPEYNPIPNFSRL